MVFLIILLAGIVGFLGCAFIVATIDARKMGELVPPPQTPQVEDKKPEPPKYVSGFGSVDDDLH